MRRCSSRCLIKWDENNIHKKVRIISSKMSFNIWLLLTPGSRDLLEKLTGTQLGKEFPTFYGTWSFITIFTTARHLSLSWASSIHSIPPHTTFWRSILLLFSHLRLGIPNGIFPSGFTTENLSTSLLSPIRATCPTVSFFSIWSAEHYWVRSSDH